MKYYLNFFSSKGIVISKEIAECLYSSILTDTGSFKFSNTTPVVHKIISKLIKLGAKPDFISNKIYEISSENYLKLLGLTVSTIKTSKNGKIAWVYITRKMIEECGTDVEESENIIGFPRQLKGVEVAAFFRELKDEDKVKVSLRSNYEVDVNKIAQVFGGGGHKKASGCFIDGNVEKAIESVIKEIEKYF